MQNITHNTVKQILFALFVVSICFGVWVVLSPFFTAIAWACILAYVSWPAYVWLLNKLGQKNILAALLMTTAMAAIVLIPILWLFFVLKSELSVATAIFTSKLANGGIVLPKFITELPFIGPDLDAWLSKALTNPVEFKNEIHALLINADQKFIDIIGGISRNFATMGFALLALFFAYKGGLKFMSQSEQVLESLLGIRARGYFQAAGDATRGVIYGIVLTAIAQGAFAGIGYWMVGLNAPIMLSAITTLFALLPFATPLVWGGIGIWLILTGNTVSGVELLLWGALVVSWIDNIIRPIILAKSVKIPFLLAFFGVIGGVSAFGLIGLFIGPVILAIAFAVWQEWLESHPDRHHHQHDA